MPLTSKNWSPNPQTQIITQQDGDETKMDDECFFVNQVEMKIQVD